MTTNMTTIFEKIKSKRNIQDRTINGYITDMKQLNKLVNGCDTFDCCCLEDFDNIVSKIDKYALSTKIKKLNTILVMLNAEGLGNPEMTRQNYMGDIVSTNKGSNQDLYDKYRKKRDELNAQNSNHGTTERELKNWITWETLQESLNKKKEKVKSLKLAQKMSLTNTEWKHLQQYVCASLYMLQRPRRCIFGGMRVVNSIGEMDDKSKNYLVNFDTHHKLFYINNQKSKKFTEPQILHVNEELNEVLNAWLHHNKSGHLLIKINSKHNKIEGSNRFEPMSKQYLSKYLHRTFKDTGKNIGPCIIRKIYHTTFTKPKMEELEKTCEEMGHTVATASAHYVKDIPK